MQIERVPGWRQPLAGVAEPCFILLFLWAFPQSQRSVGFAGPVHAICGHGLGVSDYVVATMLTDLGRFPPFCLSYCSTSFLKFLLHPLILSPSLPYLSQIYYIHSGSAVEMGSLYELHWRGFALSLSLSLSAGLAGTGQSHRRDSQALCLTSSGRVLVVLCDPLFPNSTSQICLLESWRRQPCAGLPSLPTPGKSPKMDRETLPWCSLPSTNSSHPRATSQLP